LGPITKPVNAGTADRRVAAGPGAQQSFAAAVSADVDNVGLQPRHVGHTRRRIAGQQKPFRIVRRDRQHVDPMRPAGVNVSRRHPHQERGTVRLPLGVPSPVVMVCVLAPIGSTPVSGEKLNRADPSGATDPTIGIYQ
jgi:hypothetical protein